MSLPLPVVRLVKYSIFSILVPSLKVIAVCAAPVSLIDKAAVAIPKFALTSVSVPVPPSITSTPSFLLMVSFPAPVLTTSFSSAILILSLADVPVI